MKKRCTCHSERVATHQRKSIVRDDVIINMCFECVENAKHISTITDVRPIENDGDDDNG